MGKGHALSDIVTHGDMEARLRAHKRAINGDVDNRHMELHRQISAHVNQHGQNVIDNLDVHRDLSAAYVREMRESLAEMRRLIEEVHSLMKKDGE